MQKTVEWHVTSLALNEKLWRSALNGVQPDPVAGIRHAPITGDPLWRLHVAEIATRVNSHYHSSGAETYEVVAGHGLLHCGQIEGTPASLSIKWDSPIEVKTGDAFSIPANCVHQLERNSNDLLIILFACPDDHLSADRHLVEDSPYLQKHEHLR